MKKLACACVALFIAAFLCSPASAEMATIRLGTPMAKAGAAADQDKKPTAYVLEAKTAPTLDGKLDEEVWQNAPVLKLARTLEGSGAAAQPTELRLCRNGTTLYVGVRAFESLMDKVRASRRSHDGPIWSDDSIELFIGTGGQYCHFGVNAVGSTMDAKGKGGEWDAGPEFKAASGREKNIWTIEIAIPLAKIAGTDKLPTDWIANFNRNRYAAGDLQESSWSPTMSGDSHVPDRFGLMILKDPPAAAPKETIEKEDLTVLPVENGECVLRFELSAVPKGAKIFRADLIPARAVQVDGRHDEILTDIEIYPLFYEFKAKDKAKTEGKPLAVRSPWFDCFDATDAVQQWVGGKPNGGFFVRACPFINAPAACLKISFEGAAKDAPKQVSAVKAFHRSGQTFVTWKEISDPVGRDEIQWGPLKIILDGLDRAGQLRYCVYRSAKPITATSLPEAELIAEVKPGSAWNLNGRSVERGIDWNLANTYAYMHGHWNPFAQASQDGDWGRDCPIDRLVIEDGKAPLARDAGLYVHTPGKDEKAYYAVVTQLDGVQNTADISDANAAGPVTESIAEPEPVLQREFEPAPFWNYREKRYHYVRWVAPPYCNVPSQYYNWAVAIPDVKLSDKYPLELCLHHDDRSYWRTQYRIEHDSIIVNPHDFPFETLWYGYHESFGTFKSYKQGVVQPYTERRVLWFIDWVARKWPVDRNRITVTAVRRSAGGAGPSDRGGGTSGALHLAFRHPDLFNMVLAGGGDPDYSDGASGAMQTIWGKVDWALKTDSGTNVWDDLNLVKLVESYPATKELPLATFTGRNVPPRVGDFMAAILAKGGGAIASFGEYGGPKLIPISASGTWPGAMIRLDVRRNLLMPTFGRSSAGSFKGGAVKYTGLNLEYRWRSDDIVDKPDRIELTLWRGGGKTNPNTDITLRRIQNFKVEPGKTYAWKLGDKEGEVAADPDGLFTIRGAAIPAAPGKLVVTPK